MVTNHAAAIYDIEAQVFNEIRLISFNEAKAMTGRLLRTLPGSVARPPVGFNSALGRGSARCHRRTGIQFGQMIEPHLVPHELAHWAEFQLYGSMKDHEEKWAALYVHLASHTPYLGPLYAKELEIAFGSIFK